ncbi:MAG: RICIN domain-containing protein, partial [Floccifex sp.]
SINNNKVIDIKSGSFDAGAIVQIYDSNGTQAQKFEIVKLSDGYHAIKNVASGYYVLNVNSIKDLKNGIGLYQGSLPSNSLNGRYIFKKDSSGKWIITSAWDNNFVIDLTGANTSNGTRIELYTYTNSNRQKWNLVRFKTDQEILDELALANKNVLIDRSFEFESVGKTNYVLDVASASTNNGANIQIYQSNGTNAQYFTVSHTSDGYVILKNIKSGKVISVEGNKVSSSTNIVQNTYSGLKGQLWIVVKDGNGYKIVSALNSEYCIGYTSSNNVVLTRYTNSSSQKWTFERLMSEYANEYKNAVADGTYEFTSSNLSVDIQSGSLQNGGNAVLSSISTVSSQIWKISHDASGYVTFTNYQSGKVLDVTSAKAVSGTNVQQYQSNGTNAQKWIVVPTSSGYQIISALSPNLYLNVSSNNINISSNQKNNWSLVKVLSPEEKMDLMAKDNKDVLSEGTYEFANISANKSLDVVSAKKDSGVNVQLYQSNSTLAQAWKVTKTSDGYLILTNVNSGKVLDVSSAGKYFGANVQQYAYNGTRAQLWVAVQGENGIQLISALGNHLALGFNGTNACLVSSKNISNTTWNDLTFKTQRDKINDLAKVHANDAQEGTYIITSSINTNYALDVKGASQANSANVQLYESNGTNAQKWQLTKDSNGYFTLISLCSNKALDVNAGKAVNSQNVQQYQSNGTWAQKWILVKNANGTYTFVSAIDSNYVLDVSAGKAVNAQNVQIYSSNGTKAQQFYLTKV